MWLFLSVIIICICIYLYLAANALSPRQNGTRQGPVSDPPAQRRSPEVDLAGGESERNRNPSQREPGAAFYRWLQELSQEELDKELRKMQETDIDLVNPTEVRAAIREQERRNEELEKSIQQKEEMNKLKMEERKRIIDKDTERLLEENERLLAAMTPEKRLKFKEDKKKDELLEERLRKEKETIAKLKAELSLRKNKSEPQDDDAAIQVKLKRLNTWIERWGLKWAKEVDIATLLSQIGQDRTTTQELFESLGPIIRFDQGKPSEFPAGLLTDGLRDTMPRLCLSALLAYWVYGTVFTDPFVILRYFEEPKKKRDGILDDLDLSVSDSNSESVYKSTTFMHETFQTSEKGPAEAHEWRRNLMSILDPPEPWKNQPPVSTEEAQTREKGAVRAGKLKDLATQDFVSQLLSFPVIKLFLREVTPEDFKSRQTSLTAIHGLALDISGKLWRTQESLTCYYVLKDLPEDELLYDEERMETYSIKGNPGGNIKMMITPLLLGKRRADEDNREAVWAKADVVMGG